MNDTRITVHGYLANEPVAREGRNGSVFTTFRIGTTPFRRTAEGNYVNGETSFYSVIAFGRLAANLAASLRKGQPVIIEGKLTNKSYVGSDGQSRTAPEIEAERLGHDLTYGRAAFERLSKAAALGLDRTSDADVRTEVERQRRDAEVAAAATGQDGLDAAAALAAYGELDRPAHVDENGVVHGPLGDPETDAYQIEEDAA